MQVTKGSKLKEKIEADKLTAEVLVPRTFVWWTFLALATDLSDPFKEVRFVKELNGRSDVVIVHSSLVERLSEMGDYKPFVIILLWDGFQSYLDCKTAIDRVCSCASRAELRVVGDLGSVGDQHPSVCKIRRLFAQQVDLYDKRIVHSNIMKRFRFLGPWGKLGIKLRSKMMSFKVFVQLVLSDRLAEYRRTKYVFCGSTGLYTLQKFSRNYGLAPEHCAYDKGGIRCDGDFLLRWMTAIARERRDSTDPIVIRALLRLIALRKLQEVAGRDIFLNTFPEANINSYQAEMLFGRHIFLEFGGINGDEAIYPRSADLHLFKRRMICFDSKVTAQKLLGLGQGEVDLAKSAIKSYEEQVVSTFVKLSSM